MESDGTEQDSLPCRNVANVYPMLVGVAINETVSGNADSCRLPKVAGTLRLYWGYGSS